MSTFVDCLAIRETAMHVEGILWKAGPGCGRAGAWDAACRPAKADFAIFQWLMHSLPRADFSLLQRRFMPIANLTQ